MKILRKMLSILTASASFFSLIATNANAAVFTYDKNSDEYKEMIEGFVEFDDGGHLSIGQGNTVFKAFYNEEKDELMRINFPDDEFAYKIPNDENAEKAIEMTKQNKNWNLISNKSNDKYVFVVVRVPSDDTEKNYKDVADFAKKLREITTVEEFNFSFALVHPYHVPMETKQLTYYFRDNYELSTNKEELIRYVEENKLDYTIDFSTDYKYLPDDADAVTLIPNGETTIEERFKVIKQIADDLGLDVVQGITPASVSPLEYGETIDMANNVNGDANCDKIATMADAAAILQAIGNPDKYALSRQGEFNADYAGDGLTAEDAIAIQKKLAGIE